MYYPTTSTTCLVSKCTIQQLALHVIFSLSFQACPAGYYCLANTTDYQVYDCPAGHYCPENTTYDMEFPCPPQTFNNLTNGQAMDSCVSCLPGMYCSGYGNTWPTGNCSAGYFCTNGSDTATVNTDDLKWHKFILKSSFPLSFFLIIFQFQMYVINLIQNYQIFRIAFS